MGQKINPHGFRLGITTDWKSRWYADKQYSEYVKEDVAIRRRLFAPFVIPGERNVELERAGVAAGNGMVPASIRLLATDAPDRFARVAANFLPFPITAAMVELVDLQQAGAISTSKDTVSYFAERAARADIPKALEILKRAGVGNPPVPGNDLSNQG